MAKNKTIKFDGNTTISITPKSKNLTYEYSGNTSYSFQINNEFISDGKVIDGYKSYFQNFATKRKDDLVITTLFVTYGGKVKKITSVVKNFFLDDTKDYTVKYNTYYPISATSENLTTLTIRPDTEYGTNGLYNTDGIENDYYTNYFLGTNKKDIYEFIDNYSNYIYEPKGNDEYLSRHANKIDYIYDLTGNDEYKILQDNTSSGIMYSYDYLGEDEYTADGQYARLYSKDYSGSDEYELKNGAEFWVEDYKGNDEYEVNANKSDAEAINRRINDYKGNDEYELINATVDIVDHSGKDEYEIKNITSNNILSITDDSNSKDKYKVSNSVDIVADSLSIFDAAGNDKHYWTNVKFTTLSDEGNYAIKDEYGNDKYTLRDVKNIRIYDGNGKDKYDFKNLYDTKNKTFTSVSDFQIKDCGNKNDKYDLQFVSCEYAEDDETSRTIIDDGGNDKYTLASSSGIRINDKSGNDTYDLKAPVDKKGKKIKFESEEAFAAINGKSEIYDDKGNDKYNISYAMGTKIYDSEGKDTYNIKGSTISQTSKFTEEITLDLTMPTVSMLEIHDTSTTSADTYNIANVTGSSGIIGLGLHTPVITDDGGNNKFNIKNAGSYISIKEIQEATENKDKGKLLSLFWSMPSFGIRCMGVGDDRYNIKNSFLMTSISDSKGNDKYSFKNVSGSIIASDNEGNDKYTISKNKAGIEITDNSGNDTYTLDKLKKTKVGTLEGAADILINDKEGNDTLKISSLKKSNIIYMANFSNDVSTNYMDSQDFGLIIYDKKNGGFVDLVDFYETTETQITGLKNSIETLKAGKKSINLTTAAGDFSKMEAVREQVGAWLADSGRNFDDVRQVLSEGSKEDIASLVQMFQTGM